MASLRSINGVFRKSFGSTRELLASPGLIEVQFKSFNDFIQLDYLSQEREDIGLERVFRTVFPIESGNMSLQYCGYEIGVWSCLCGKLTGIEKRYSWVSSNGKESGVGRLSKEDISSGKYSYIKCKSCHVRVTLKEAMSVEEARNSGETYGMPLKIKLQLVSWEDLAGEKVVKDIKEQSVFLSSLPVMLGFHKDPQDRIFLGSEGSFLINGVSRIVVSQVYRAPGVLFSQAKKNPSSGDVFYGCRLIPARGTWVDFEFDSNGVLQVRSDKRKKIIVTTFLQALGLSRDEILPSFYDSINLVVKDNKICIELNESLIGYRFSRLDSFYEFFQGARPGSRITKSMYEAASKKFSSLPLDPDSLVDKIVCSRVMDPSTGEVLVEAGESLSLDKINLLSHLNGQEFKILKKNTGSKKPTLVKALQSDSVCSYDAAVRDFYSKMRSGDAPTFDVMEEFVKELFFSDKMYDLSELGRLRLNRKLGLNVDLKKTVLSIDDIISVVRYLVNLQEDGVGSVDDIDKLSNRCVRLVNELLQAQIYSGFARIEKIAKEKLRSAEVGVSCMPSDFINVRPLSVVLNSFFGTGQLSQFGDQTNPLAEMAHKRRLSALGPGGISRDRASLEVRDVHPSHYGRICPIETPDGHNIGLISSLATYASINDLGFIQTVYYAVNNGVVDRTNIYTLDAFEEEGKLIGQASTEIDKSGKIVQDKIYARKDGDVLFVSSKDIDYMDVSTKQLVSVATALIPFLEHDDANRALMGSNMQRQAVPLIAPKAPYVGTGVEASIARSSSGVIVSPTDGIVDYVDSEKIIISEEKKENQSFEDWISNCTKTFYLRKFNRSSHNTWRHQVPLVSRGDKISKGDVICDGEAVSSGEIALGNNVCVAYMPWRGYNFEDAIVVSNRVVSDDLFSSVHIEEIVVEARDTKLGAEEITRDVPGIGDKDLEILDEDGIVKVGTRVSPGDVLVGKITLKGDVQVSPEEKLLRAIFGDKSREVRDTSAKLPEGISGTIIDVKVFSRGGIRKDERYKSYVAKESKKLDSDFDLKKGVFERLIKSDFLKEVQALGVSLKGSDDLSLDFEGLIKKYDSPKTKDLVKQFFKIYKDKMWVLESLKSEALSKLKRGDSLPSGVIKLVRVFVAVKRPMSVGDKMAGRHGNKGVVAKIVDAADMPHLDDGTPVDVVLNPLGVPGRMNMGQILETLLGMACYNIRKNLIENKANLDSKSLKKYLCQYIGEEKLDSILSMEGVTVENVVEKICQDGFFVSSPVFDGANLEKDLLPLFKSLNMPISGQYKLRDGRTGEEFDQPVTVGFMYMMKLNHMADDKIHARSVGPYSLITQQPLGGKANKGGQRLGEMEVWALFGYGAAFALQEMLTIKSDDVAGRAKTYEAIVRGDEIPEPGLPESFNVLIKELQSLGLSVDLLKTDEGAFL